MKAEFGVYEVKVIQEFTVSAMKVQAGELTPGLWETNDRFPIPWQIKIKEVDEELTLPFQREREKEKERNIGF